MVISSETYIDGNIVLCGEEDKDL